MRYLPRLPVPIEGIADSGSVTWKMLEDNIGYIYVRRIRRDLMEKLDQAVGALQNAKGLIVDVRGNSGGGSDPSRSFRNFQPEAPEEPHRPRYAGPMAVLIDARCISAGEGWASWFVAQKRAKFFGAATAGASARKRVVSINQGQFKARVPVKFYRGDLDRIIERTGLKPDQEVRQNAKDLAQGRDTVLEAARQYLLLKSPRAAPRGIRPTNESILRIDTQKPTGCAPWDLCNKGTRSSHGEFTTEDENV